MQLPTNIIKKITMNNSARTKNMNTHRFNNCLLFIEIPET